MDTQMIQEAIVWQARSRGIGLEDAGNEVIRGMGTPREIIDSAIAELRAKAAHTQILDDPRGVATKAEARQSNWYTGPNCGDKHWPSYVEATGLEGKPEQLSSLNTASNKIVAHLADPAIRGNKKKGLVVGHVQSGKTANYAAVAAKAADAGYRIVIVMSGIHNNLRKQTQVRLNSDLSIPGLWDPLTDEDADFGQVPNGTARVASKLKMLAVVKKNSSRLKRLRDWLHNIPVEARRGCPVLLIDDEADQATPNTRAAQDELSKINELIREIWAEIPTGTYVGYTATPFANVFIDPDDETDMYPSDFIIDLPRPEAYYGAERIFGTPLQLSEEESDDGLDMARIIPDDEASDLNAPTNKNDREAWTPSMTNSLRSAVRWFLLSTAARRARSGLAEHSSMLVHTTPFVAPHFHTQGLIDDLLDELIEEMTFEGLAEFKALWDIEYPRVAPALGRTPVQWEDVALGLDDVARSTRVVVDNGSSPDRLDYGRLGPNGEEIIETVIAVGGSTLSRGLTLEGLVVSYFTRAAKTYDTLLQMGRWFGYRTGYEEFPRVWMTSTIRENFQFLAQVEWEIREEMRSMAERGVSPYQYGLRVRAHPGNLAITARNKMHFAQAVQVSYSGQRHQTIQFEEKLASVQTANLSATRELLKECVSHESSPVGNTRVFHDVGAEAVLSFLAEYSFYPGGELQGSHIVNWLQQFAAERPWNVAVVSRARDAAGQLDLGPIGMVNGLVRAPLQEPTHYANIKGLMTKGDAVVDLGPEAVRAVNAGSTYASVRNAAENANGLLVIYPISKDSKPVHNAEKTSRRPLEAPEHLIGLGIIFPLVLDGDVAEDGTFMAVRPEWTAEFEDADEFEEVQDYEQDFVAPASFSDTQDGS